MTLRPFTGLLFSCACLAQQLAQTPPMGWNSWNKFAEKINGQTVKEIADAMVSSGMKDAGYVYVNIDDTWQGKRDAEGVLQPNEKFPDMKGLADYVHSKGLKIGIYSSPDLKLVQAMRAAISTKRRTPKPGPRGASIISSTIGAAPKTYIKTRRCPPFTKKWATL
jgi:hypothetical protein